MFSEILSSIIVLGISALILFIVRYFKFKADQIKDTNMKNITSMILSSLEDTVYKSVETTNQTFVDKMKANGTWNEEAGKTAFELTKNNIISLLNDETKKVIEEQFGSLETWLQVSIESMVNRLKKN